MPGSSRGWRRTSRPGLHAKLLSSDSGPSEVPDYTGLRSTCSSVQGTLHTKVPLLRVELFCMPKLFDADSTVATGLYDTRHGNMNKAAELHTEYMFPQHQEFKPVFSTMRSCLGQNVTGCACDTFKQGC